MILYLVFIVMGICAVYDFRTKQIPPVWIALCGVLSLIESVIGVMDGLIGLSSVFMALVPGCLMLFLAFVTRRAVGYGDGLLLCAMGPTLGLRLTLTGLMFAFFLSAFAAIILLVFKKADKATRIPFVPFIASAMGVMKLVLL